MAAPDELPIVLANLRHPLRVTTYGRARDSFLRVTDVLTGHTATGTPCYQRCVILKGNVNAVSISGTLTVD